MAEQHKIIAVIDDGPGMRGALERLLSALGFQTELYGSAEEFISAATTSDAACLLVDIELGAITGAEMVRQLRAIDCTFPTIFMSGSDEETIRSQARALGCIAFLHKPFPADLLVESIVRATGPICDKLLN